MTYESYTIFVLQFIWWCYIKKAIFVLIEAATEGVLQEKIFLEISQNSQENTCARVSFLIKSQGSACNFIKKEALGQMFSCKYCEISKFTFLTEHLRASAFVLNVLTKATFSLAISQTASIVNIFWFQIDFTFLNFWLLAHTETVVC